MKVGLQISSFTWPGGDAEIGPTLARIVRTADDVGFDSIWVMDHLFQIRSVGEVEEPMLEGLTTLGFMAAHSRRARLGLMVGGVPYRQPGLWIKATTTLDVLSGGRAWLGIGAAWNVAEARALGIPFPELPDRFALLADTLQMAHHAFRGERGSEERFEGRRIVAERVLNSPQALSRPRIPILVGGGGERTTLRLVARYADACNVFGAPDVLRHKFAVLRRHCESVGRDYAEIERTNLSTISITPDGSRGSLTPGGLVERLGGWAEAGSQHTIVALRGVHDVAKLELIGRAVLPQVRTLGEPSPQV
ncbi:MAG TPA: LLM class F420-dependent oxidoreductase [Candidatus Limnocylindrales bacterium]|jgi:F420-dependent oxidoreductase-like protein|nr:LLM class F420-dependent oxidoreductase [Candidatus Limnocylindrales bacterium]